MPRPTPTALERLIIRGSCGAQSQAESSVFAAFRLDAALGIVVVVGRSCRIDSKDWVVRCDRFKSRYRCVVGNREMLPAACQPGTTLLEPPLGSQLEFP
jgi:hypothetical protein